MRSTSTLSRPTPSSRAGSPGRRRRAKGGGRTRRIVAFGLCLAMIAGLAHLADMPDPAEPAAESAEPVRLGVGEWPEDVDPPAWARQTTQPPAEIAPRTSDDPVASDLPGTPSTPRARIAASDQRSDGTQIVVDRVEIRGGDGFLVVRADHGGGPGALLGYTPVAAGATDAVTVDLRAPLSASGVVWVDVHWDLGAPGVFEGPQVDPPLGRYGPTPLVRLAVTLAGS